ncbi:hypothetical protein KGZ13_34090, partial [Pseudomonas aeruginosa]|nr:hypothetical protein [Pseudomonas aeruginosa]
VPDIGLVFCNLRLTGNRRRTPRRYAQRNSAQKANTAYQSTAALLGKAGRVASDVEAVELGAAGVASLDALWQLLVRAAVLW